MSGTRLVGAGRLCVEVPAEWPTLGRARITRSHVLVRRNRVVLAVGHPSWPEHLVVVELTTLTPGRPRQEPPFVAPPWTPDVLAGHPAVVLREDTGRGRSWHRWSVDPLGAHLDLGGPADLCRAIEDTATVIEAGSTAVPNPWLDVRGGDFGEVVRDADYLRDVFDRCGLVAAFAGTPAGPGERTRVVGCDPSPTTVVPVGTTVTVTVTRRRPLNAERRNLRVERRKTGV